MEKLAHQKIKWTLTQEYAYTTGLKTLQLRKTKTFHARDVCFIVHGEASLIKDQLVRKT